MIAAGRTCGRNTVGRENSGRASGRGGAGYWIFFKQLRAAVRVLCLHYSDPMRESFWSPQAMFAENPAGTGGPYGIKLGVICYSRRKQNYGCRLGSETTGSPFRNASKAGFFGFWGF